MAACTSALASGLPLSAFSRLASWSDVRRGAVTQKQLLRDRLIISVPEGRGVAKDDRLSSLQQSCQCAGLPAGFR
jgi:hypothetical protein